MLSPAKWLLGYVSRYVQRIEVDGILSTECGAGVAIDSRRVIQISCVSAGVQIIEVAHK